MGLKEELRQLAIGYGWTYPFFLPALSEIVIHEVQGDDIRTMAVDKDGNVYVNVEWTKQLPQAQMVGVLFHEIMHLMMDHAHRQEGRNVLVEGQTPSGETITLPLWNVTADMAINNVLREMQLQLPPSAVYPPHGANDMNAEQLYEHMLKTMPQSKNKGRMMIGDGEGAFKVEAGAGCGVRQGKDGQQKSQGQGDQDGQGNGGQPQEQDSGADKWEKIAVQARALAAGTAHGNALAKLFTRRESVSWEQLCRSTVSRAVAQHGRDEQTWTRRNRRSPGRIILPGWKATKACGLCIIDASGSMSDEMLSRAVDQIQRIAELAEARVWVIVHDHGVQTSGWVNGRDRTAIGKCVIGRGGTSFDEAYKVAGEVPHRFDFMVHLTDGEVGGTWPARPDNCRRMVVALIGQRGTAGYGWASTPPNDADIVHVDMD